MGDGITLIIGIMTIVILSAIFVILGAGIFMNYMKSKNEDEEKLSISERKIIEERKRRK